MTKVKQKRSRAVQRSLGWIDPEAERTRSMIDGWRTTREGLANGERLGDLLETAIAAYEGRPYPGDSVLQGQGARRFAEWGARCEVLRGVAATLLDTFGFVEVLNTPWVALHHAHAFDVRAPHDSAHCGLCIASAEEEDGAPPAVGPISERLRYGPLPPRSLPFVIAERLELLATYSTPRDQPGSPFAPEVRVAAGGLEVHELFLTSAVTNALEHVGLISVLEANNVRCTVRPAGDTKKAVEPRDGRDTPVVELSEGVIDGLPRAAGRLHESLRYNLRGEVLRWLVMSGRVPNEAEWSGLADWPSAELITAAYGSFDALIDACALDSSEYLRKARRLEAEREKTRELTEDAERRLERAAARERELAVTNGRADDLSRATAEAARLRASLVVLEARTNSLDADRGHLEVAGLQRQSSLRRGGFARDRS